MLMLANQRERSQIQDELSLFLKSDTDSFVEWLWERAKEVPFRSLSITAATTGKKSSIEDDLTNKPEDTENRRIVRTKDSCNMRKTGESSRMRDKSSQDERVSSTNRKKIFRGDRRRRGRGQTSDDENSYDPMNSYSKSYDDNIKHEEYSPKPILKEEPGLDPYRPEDQEVVLHLRHDDNDELMCSNEGPVFELDKDERLGHQQRIAAEQRYSRLRSNENYGPTSTIGAIVRHENNLNYNNAEDDDIDTRYNVSSIVTISERKSSVPKNLQASSKLVLKAMQDANNSIGREREYLKRKLVDLDVPYTPTPIKRRLGPKVSNDDYDEDYEDLQGK